MKWFRNLFSFIKKHKITFATTSIAIVAAVVGLLVASPIFEAKKQKQELIVADPVRPVKIITIQTGIEKKANSISYPGIVRASKKVDLAFKIVGGRIVQFPVEGKEGQYVNEGDLLVKLDTTDLEVNLKNAEAQMKKGEAAYGLAQTEYFREKRIYNTDPGASSTSILHQQRRRYEIASADMQSAQAALDNAANQLSYTSLHAPFSGVIAKTYANNYQVVQPFRPILSLQDISKLEIHVDLPESFMKKIKYLMQRKPSKSKDTVIAYAEFPNLLPAEKFPLRAKEYSIEADRATQTFKIVLQMPQPIDIKILPGMSARVWTSIDNSEHLSQGVVIPSTCVLGDTQGKSYVWVIDSQQMTVAKRYVKLGELTGSSNITILDGLKSDEKIVLTGLTKLRDGMKVKMWDPDKTL